MLSLIICSRGAIIPNELTENIHSTVGAEYELIVIDNSQNNYSIFSAYNEGVRHAKYPYLCFMHDDILFNTNEWGKMVIAHFQDENVGLIGVLGGHYLPDCPSYWNTSRHISGKVLDEKQKLWNWDRYLDSGKTIDVASVDGLWFCIPKMMFKKICFDEKIGGFHGYDTDICMQITGLGHTIRVVGDILITHSSGGNHTEQFHLAMGKIYEKWAACLPVIKGIDLKDADIEDRKYLAKKEYDLLSEYWRLNSELVNCNKSNAYRLGKFILTPFRVIRKLLS